MHGAMIRDMTRQARARALPAAVLTAALMTGAPAAHAESAYIAQATGKTGVTLSSAVSQPVQMVPAMDTSPRQTTYVATPELARPRGSNIAATLQIGNSNQVLQAQAGGNNFSNVGVIGGSDNNVAVLQGGRDISNLNLVNTQGLTVAVIQPPGAAPINMLIARLPNGGLLIKR